MNRAPLVSFSSDFEIIRNTPCVYEIRNMRNNKVYIGSCLSISQRLRVHKSKLRKGIASPYLQNEYDKYKDQYSMKALEYCNADNLISREQYWLDRYFDNQQQCYNINPTAYSQLGFVHSDETKTLLSQKTRKVTVELVSISGELITVVGIKKFCKENNLHESGFLLLRKGKIESYRGWRLASKKDQPYILPQNLRAEKLKKTFNVHLVSPTNEIYGPIINMKKFCRDHGLYPQLIRNLLTGNVKIAKGWKLLSNQNMTEKDIEQNRIKKISNTYDVKIQSPDGKIYGPITNLREFCKEHSLSWGSMHDFLTGKKLSYKNWKILNQ
jgi:group I intron endonuclease